MMRRKATHLTTLLWLIIAASVLLFSAVLKRPPIIMLAVATTDADTAAAADAVDATTSSEGCKNNDNNDDETCTNSEAEATSTESSSEEPQLSPAGERLITPTELASHGIKSTESKEAATDGGKHTIWLSILGRVYDVTSGGPSYYGPKGSYNFYSGRDASPCFHSGQNNEEGASAKLEEWTDDKHLMSVYDWSLFYEKHETYKFMGVLINSNYYNENGEETDVRKDIVGRASKAKAIVEKEREERKKARLEKRKADREKNVGK